MQVEATATAIVTEAHRRTGQLRKFDAIDDEGIRMSVVHPVRSSAQLRLDTVVTVTFRDRFRCATFLAHVTAVHDEGTVTLTVPKQIVTRDQRRSPRVQISERASCGSSSRTATAPCAG